MTKVELFSKELQGTASLFKALGHPARLAILNHLSDANICISGDISKELPLSRTTVNQHLAELKNIGIIKGEIEGSRTCYCINPSIVTKLKSITSSLFDSLSCCDNPNC